MNETKEKILNIAQTLFMQKGYNATTIQDIITAAKTSKGGFYHHFSSKEALIVEFTQKMTKQQMEKLRPIVNQQGKNALEKMNELFSVSNKMKAERPELLKAIFEGLFGPDNLPYRKAIEDASVRVTVELLEVLISEGQKQGLFLPGPPYYLADIIARQGILLAEQIGEAVISAKTADKNKLTVLVDTYELAIERILGVKENDHIHIIDKKTIIRLMEYLQKEERAVL